MLVALPETSPGGRDGCHSEHMFGEGFGENVMFEQRLRMRRNEPLRFQREGCYGQREQQRSWLGHVPDASMSSWKAHVAGVEERGAISARPWGPV